MRIVRLLMKYKFSEQFIFGAIRLLLKSTDTVYLFFTLDSNGPEEELWTYKGHRMGWLVSAAAVVEYGKTGGYSGIALI